MIESPSKSAKLRASWGSAVADAVNRHEAALSVKAARIANGRDAIGEAFPFQAIGGSYEGSATITLYVPAGSVVVADEEIDAGDIDGISAVDGAPGYYTVDDLDDLATTAAGAQPLYLIVWRDDTATDPTTSATVTLDPESVEGTVILQATIARVWASTPEGGSRTYGAVAEQIVRSAVILGSQTGAGGGTGGSTSGYSGTRHVPYAYEGPRSDGKLYAKTKKWTYENGLLKTISTEDGDDILVADTVAHSGL